MNRISKTELLIWVVAAELFGAVSALAGGNFSGYYETLKTPPLSPPSWLFPIMWGIIYALLGASAYLVFKVSGKADKTTKSIFALQLAVNFMWNIIFFRFHSLVIAAAVLIVLTVLVGIMLLDFYRKDKLAGLMNIIYLLWCSFACYLNIGIAILN